MREDNKIPLSEVHRQLNMRAGRIISAEHFEDLLWCWRKFDHKKTAGKDGWLSPTNRNRFLNYAY